MAVTRAELAFLEYLMAPEAPPLPSFADLLRRPAWQERAACRGQGVDDFFPERGQSVKPAREVCSGCSVTRECLDFAMGGGEVSDGIWAGTSPKQRAALRREAS